MKIALKSHVAVSALKTHTPIYNRNKMKTMGGEGIFSWLISICCLKNIYSFYVRPRCKNQIPTLIVIFVLKLKLPSREVLWLKTKF